VRTISQRSGPAPSRVEKGGASFEGITLLLCESPLPPLDAAIEAAAAELPASNHYTEPHSQPLRTALASHLGVDEANIHVNAGSELILRQLFDRFGARTHLVTPTYALFPEIAGAFTQTRLEPASSFAFDLARLALPHGTTLVAIVNPSNPTGVDADTSQLPGLLDRHPDVLFLLDEAFVEFGVTSTVPLVAEHPNLVVTRTFSKAHSLAGLRVGYAVTSRGLVAELDAANDAYPLARPSQAAALATLAHLAAVRERVELLRGWARSLAEALTALGVVVYPSATYFFLADTSPVPATAVAARLAKRGILVRPLDDPDLGPGFLRVTTALPEQNEQVVAGFAAALSG
jgi:histidinol-phosphate aminotransferase